MITASRCFRALCAAGVLLPTACAAHHAAGHAAEDLAAPVLGGVSDQDVGGLRLLVKRVSRSKLVAAQLFFEGGARNWSSGNAGTEWLALGSAVTGGAEDLPGPMFQQRLAALGSRIEVESTESYSVLKVESLRPHWQATLDLLTDMLLHPALPPPEVEANRQLQLSALQREHDDPDGQLAERSHEMFYRGLPEANRATGTPASLARLGRPELLAHLASLRQKSQWLLVVVGDVDPAEVAAWTEKAFAEVPRGVWAPEQFRPPIFKAPKVELTARPLAKTYAMATFPTPGWRDPALAVAMVAINVFRERAFEELRLQHQLAEAPGIGLGLGVSGEAFFSGLCRESQPALAAHT